MIQATPATIASTPERQLLDDVGEHQAERR
jgi:hypothetical protein